ncbi:hypothetical protein U0070_009053 [Myodes glareolus]|uniref:SUZ RNA-binding domain-containing n=1 Tax=Myodes glareolus TaxID=447135 RepID=A0AAW0H5T0_MYOGA
MCAGIKSVPDDTRPALRCLFALLPTRMFVLALNELFPIIALLSTTAFCRRLCSPHTEGKGIYSSEAELSFWYRKEIDRRLEKKLKITQKERSCFLWSPLGPFHSETQSTQLLPFLTTQALAKVSVVVTGLGWPGGWKSKSPPKVPIVIQDDSLPTGPPPQIRILKRPTSNGVVSSPNSTSRPALPVKSLAQREAEYAEARRRILGSASPEEEQEKPILDSTRSQQLASWFGGKQEADRPTRISQPEDSRQPSNVIRQPLGPDGSQGFKQRR